MWGFDLVYGLGKYVFDIWFLYYLFTWKPTDFANLINPAYATLEDQQFNATVFLLLTRIVMGLTIVLRTGTAVWDVFVSTLAEMLKVMDEDIADLEEVQ